MEIKIFFALFLQLMLISSSSSQTDSPSSNSQDLVTATKEMQKANYFTFVMLIKMSPPDTRLQENVTFLMPNDRILATMVLQQGSISSFLQRHSIPSPLLFDTLKQFPTGTTIPTSLPNCMLKISNNGRKNFVLNNVKIVSPNVCVSGSSIRCHGIDGILSEDDCVSSSSMNSTNDSSVPPPSSLPPPISQCPNGTNPNSCKALPPIPSPSLPLAPPSDQNISPPPSPLIAPSPIEANVGPVKSGSSEPLWFCFHGSLNFVAGLILSMVGIYL